MNIKTKKSQEELLNQFKSEIALGACNLSYYEYVSRLLENIIDESPNEESMTKIFDLIGSDNVHFENWISYKFDCLEAIPESQKGIIVKLYQTVFTKRMLKSFRYLYIYQNSLPKLLMHMELFPLMEMWFKTNIPKAVIDSDELVTNMCDFINDAYELDKSDFEKIYSNYVDDNLAA